MNAPAEHSANADRRYREWMRERLERAARDFGVSVTGEPVFGWRDRSIAAPARVGDQPRWLRVVTESPTWAHGPTWTGNLDSNTLADLPKPTVLLASDWRDNPARHIRAELMTRLSGASCSPDPTPGPDLTLDERWWSQLTGFLRDLSRSSTARVHADQAKVNRRVASAFGPDAVVTIDRWETVHGDLHWANLHHDPFGVLDWESWGRGPAGTDAATLYLYSLAAPDIAAVTRAHLADILDSPAGRAAQLYVAARLLHRSTLGDHPHLVAPLRDLAHSLLTDTERSFPV